MSVWSSVLTDYFWQLHVTEMVRTARNPSKIANRYTTWIVMVTWHGFPIIETSHKPGRFYVTVNRKNMSILSATYVRRKILHVTLRHLPKIRYGPSLYIYTRYPFARTDQIFYSAIHNRFTTFFRQLKRFSKGPLLVPGGCFTKILSWT